MTASALVEVRADPPPSEGPRDAGDRQPSRFRRLGPRSITSRIVVGVVSLVAVLVLIIGGGTYFALRSFLGGKLDQQLQSTVDNASSGFRSTGYGPAALSVYAVGLDPNTGAVVGRPSGESDDELKLLRLSADQREYLAGMSPNASPVTVHTLDGLEVRVVVQRTTIGDGFTAQRVVAVIGLSTSDERQTLRRLLLLEALIGAAAVLLALLATSYGVQFSLRRLRGVTNTAQEVAEELSPEGAGLDRRVPMTDDDTEVGQLATSFNTMLAAVETQFAARLESEQRMRQFMADASHELRTPLTSIRGFAELARMQRAVGDTSGDNLDRIEAEGTRMSRLVDDLLLLARGDADGADRVARRELVDVGALLDDAVSGSRAAFAGRDVGLDYAGTPAVLGDRDQLLRVVRNLITNAAVHTAPDRPITVRGFSDPSGVTIQVVDGGPGLTPEDAAHVFERFWRADKARTRARGGSGLGLSIVAAVVRAHGGTVRFDSAVETGSTVTVTLPIASSIEP